MNEGQEAVLLTQFPAGQVEMQEFLFASTYCRAAGCSPEVERKRVLELRELLRLHRFTVISWLMANGVAVPGDLIADQNHPVVGQQLPDQPVQTEPPRLEAPAKAADYVPPQIVAAPPVEQKFWWVSFGSGHSGCVRAPDMGAADKRAAVIGDVQSVKQLPYAASPYLFPDDMAGVPDFCYQPNYCAGRTCCPSNRACSE